MNIYELMDDLYTRYAYLSAGGDDNAEWPFTPIRELVEAYYMLEPSPDDWPADANWFTIDADGLADWSIDYPTSNQFWCEWRSGTNKEAGRYVLAPGIDWRLCIWQRPEAQ